MSLEAESFLDPPDKNSAWLIPFLVLYQMSNHCLLNYLFLTLVYSCSYLTLLVLMILLLHHLVTLI